MKTEKGSSTEFIALREKAEAKIKKKKVVKTASITEADVLRLHHELEVHQVELEMQNEELKSALEKARKATEKFIILYDFAYPGYFTLNFDGRILGMNISGARILGKESANLVNRKFSQFVTLDTRSVFNDFFQKVIETNLQNQCEVRLIVEASPSVFVYMEGVVSEDDQTYMITVVDVTKRIYAEEILKLKAHEFELFNELINVRDSQISQFKEEINLLLKNQGKAEKFMITR